METDLIGEMCCRNCKNLVMGSDGILRCLNRHEGQYVTDVVTAGDSCIYFDKIEENVGRKMFTKIRNILKFYVDMKEEQFDITALWILGTYQHKSFLTFPYLYFNAMKASAKTRTLKLIKSLSKEGDMLASISEAVLFRTTGTLCIDEFESIGNKGKEALREVLNTSYKHGGKVKRMRKKKTIDGEEQVVEEFDTFRPIAIANISGMEEVLNDRCITLILEKSSNKAVTKKMEDFDNNPEILQIKANLEENWCSLCSVVNPKNIYKDWNMYINSSYTTLHTYTTLTTQTTQNYTNYGDLFMKIDKLDIDGRNLEIYFPLIIIANSIGMLDYFLDIVKKKVCERKFDDVMESKDVRLFEFAGKQNKDWFRVKELTAIFRNYCGEEEGEDNWLNARWMGKALKRLNLIAEKRRIGEGIEVKLDVEKAKQKMEMFK